MPIDVSTWKKLFTLFNPLERLEYNQGDLFVSRPGSVAQEIADMLSLEVQPTGKWVVCGSMGSGKSSELVYLARLLENTHSVVAVDMLRSVRSESEDTVNQIQASEVLFAIGAGAIRMAREDLGHEVPENLVHDLTSSFEKLLPEGHGIDLGSILLGVVRFVTSVTSPGEAAVEKAAVGAAGATTGLLGSRRDLKLGGLTRPVKEGDTGFEKLRISVDNVLSHLRDLGRGLVVLVDGLDKVNDSGRIRELFATTRILAAPWAQIVYTAPIDLMLGPLWNAAGGAFNRERLTNVLVEEPALERANVSPEAVAEGRQAMGDVVHRRLQRLGLSVDDVFEDGSLDVLIRASGGLLRDMIHLVNKSVLEALRKRSVKITEEMARDAVVKLRKEFEITLTTQRVNELRHVRKHGETSSDEEFVLDLLHGGYILPYSNGGSWFEPHPILRGLREGL